MCEPYGNTSTKADVCSNILRPDTDYVYVNNSVGSLGYITSFLNDKTHNVENLLAIHDKECLDLVFSHNYIPPCGTTNQTFPPSSLCQEECTRVQSECGPTWKAAELAIGHDSFIDCNDTSRLLFPLPNCCTGAGIQFKKETSSIAPTVIVETETDTTSGGAVAAGIGLGVLMFLILVVAAPVLLVLLGIRYKRRHRRKALERIQMDIRAM